MEQRITITNNVGELLVLAAAVEELAERWELPIPLTMNINLVLEEAVSNIIFYAFPDQKEHKIEITIRKENDTLTLVIEDDGVSFDPTSKELPDIDLPAEERPIGGLGIFLISKIMDNVSYKREQEKNSLTLKKKL